MKNDNETQSQLESVTAELLKFAMLHGRSKTLRLIKKMERSDRAHAKIWQSFGERLDQIIWFDK